MENMGMGVFVDGEWESLCKLFTFEEPDFPNALFLSNQQSYENSHMNEYSHLGLVRDTFLPTNFGEIDGGNNNDTSFLTSFLHHSICNEVVVLNNIADVSSSSHAAGVSEDNQSSYVGSPVSMEEGQLKRKSSTLEMESEIEQKSASLVPKKRARATNNRVKEDEAAATAGSNGQSISGENSDDGSNACQEGSEGENLTSKGKKRASRGAATDPQSLYARRRRERINERLRILQNLVPNGTKVDISTMLEEAVHYVKFLQLQIRLLSSDELWMYAPIAYNGVDISLYKRISPFLLP